MKTTLTGTINSFNKDLYEKNKNYNIEIKTNILLSNCMIRELFCRVTDINRLVLGFLHLFIFMCALRYVAVMMLRN